MNYKRIPLAYPPGELILEELDARGWKQVDLAEIMGYTPHYVNNIISGRTSISPEIAADLSYAFGTSAEFWLNMQSAYNLAKMSRISDDNISRRAYIYDKYPIREMKKRGWIKDSKDATELDSELCRFLRKSKIDDKCPIPLAARKTKKGGDVTPETE